MGITCAKAPYMMSRSRKNTFTLSQDAKENQVTHAISVAALKSLPEGYLLHNNVLKPICQSGSLQNGTINNNNVNSLNNVNNKVLLRNSSAHSQISHSKSSLYTDCHPEADLNTQSTMSSVRMWFLKRGITFKRKLGQGAYANVFLADSKVNCGHVAVKVIDMVGQNRRYSANRQLAIEREVEAMCSLRHEHIIQVLQRPVKLYGRFLCLVLELAYQDLFEYIQKKGRFTDYFNH